MDCRRAPYLRRAVIVKLLSSFDIPTILLGSLWERSLPKFLNFFSELANGPRALTLHPFSQRVLLQSARTLSKTIQNRGVIRQRKTPWAGDTEMAA